VVFTTSVLADVSDGEPSAETLAVRFANSENANLFKQKFEDAQASNTKLASGGDAANKAPETTSDATETTSSGIYCVFKFFRIIC